MTPSGRGAFNTLPLICNVHDYHVLAEVNLDPKAESATLDLQVDPGRSLTVDAVDPEGQPVGGTKATGLTDLFSTHRVRAGIARRSRSTPSTRRSPGA